MGSSTLAASRTKRRITQVPSGGRAFDGNSIHQPTPATETVAARTTITSAIPQPTLATAWAIESRPIQMVTAPTAAIPVNQAKTPACAIISAPPPCYQGDLMSKDVVAPTPIVSWLGVPRCATSGELAASPVSRSYSTNACVANCGVQ